MITNTFFLRGGTLFWRNIQWHGSRANSKKTRPWLYNTYMNKIGRQNTAICGNFSIIGSWKWVISTARPAGAKRNLFSSLRREKGPRRCSYLAIDKHSFQWKNARIKFFKSFFNKMFSQNNIFLKKVWVRWWMYIQKRAKGLHTHFLWDFGGFCSLLNKYLQNTKEPWDLLINSAL